jgi:hypothetical protein
MCTFGEMASDQRMPVRRPTMWRRERPLRKDSCHDECAVEDSSKIACVQTACKRMGRLPASRCTRNPYQRSPLEFNQCRPSFTGNGDGTDNQQGPRHMERGRQVWGKMPLWAKMRAGRVCASKVPQTKSWGNLVPAAVNIRMIVGSRERKKRQLFWATA